MEGHRQPVSEATPELSVMEVESQGGGRNNVEPVPTQHVANHMRELGRGCELLELYSVGDGIASRLWHVRVTSDV